MSIPLQEAAQPNVEDGFVICSSIRVRKRYLDIRLPTFVKIPNHASVLGGHGKRPALRIPHRPACIELSGYHDQTGRFVQVDPPLRIPLAAVSTDGTLDAAQLAQMVAAVSPERTMQ